MLELLVLVCLIFIGALWPGKVDAVPPLIDEVFSTVFDPMKEKSNRYYFDAGIYRIPEYEGSQTGIVVPAVTMLLSHRFQSTIVSASLSGVSYHTPEKAYGFGTAVSVDYGRSEVAANFIQPGSESLKGMGDVGPSLELAAVGWVSIKELPVIASIRKAVTTDGHRGTILDLSTAVDILSIANRYVLSLGVTATFADANYLNHYFGVDATQSKTTGRRTYYFDAGFKCVTFDAYANYYLNRRLAAFGASALSLFSGSLQGSPLVNTSVSLSFGAGMSYAF